MARKREKDGELGEFRAGLLAVRARRQHAQRGIREAELDGTLLGVLLVLHPVKLTVAELARELGGPAPEIEDGVKRLVAGGLVHRHGEFLFPTRAAIYHDELF